MSRRRPPARGVPGSGAASRRSVPATRRVRRALAALGAAAIVAAPGCAPHRLERPRLEVETLRGRYEAAVAARAERARAADAELGLWARSDLTGDLPGASGRLLLAGPDAFRLRVTSLFGTVLDAAASGDSLAVLGPRERHALVLPSAAESLGVRDPGSLGCRLWSGAWDPPAAAWRDAAWEDSLLSLAWVEQGDSVRLSVGSHGLPAALHVQGRGRGLTVTYESWSAIDGVAWPAVAGCADDDGRFAIRWRTQRVRFPRALDPQRLRLEIPERARVVTLAELATRLRRLVPQ